MIGDWLRYEDGSGRRRVQGSSGLSSTQDTCMFFLQTWKNSQLPFAFSNLIIVNALNFHALNFHAFGLCRNILPSLERLFIIGGGHRNTY